MNRLEGKRAVIVGADPITIGIATRYAAEGALVTMLDDAATLPTIEDVTMIAIETGDPEAARAAIAEAAGTVLDVLVLAGTDIPEEADWRPIGMLTLAQLRASEDRLVHLALVSVQACEGALRAAGNASIIFLFSPAGLYSEGGWADRTIGYHARHGLMRALAAEWGPVRANMLVPFADTPGYRAFRERNPGEVDWRVSVTGMGRVGDAVRDIGGAAVFLGSDDTQYLTGMMVHADGGAMMSTPVVETAMEPAA